MEIFIEYGKLEINVRTVLIMLKLSRRSNTKSQLNVTTFMRKSVTTLLLPNTTQVRWRNVRRILRNNVTLNLKLLRKTKQNSFAENLWYWTSVLMMVTMMMTMYNVRLNTKQNAHKSLMKFRYYFLWIHKSEKLLFDNTNFRLWDLKNIFVNFKGWWRLYWVSWCERRSMREKYFWIFYSWELLHGSKASVHSDQKTNQKVNSKWTLYTCATWVLFSTWLQLQHCQVWERM